MDEILIQKEFIIPDNIKIIGDGAIQNSKLNGIYFNKNVREVGPRAFSGLGDIIFHYGGTANNFSHIDFPIKDYDQTRGFGGTTITVKCTDGTYKFNDLV